MGIKLAFTPEAYEEIAKQALEEKTGARGLMTVLERALRDFKFELPSLEVSKLIVTDVMIRNPGAGLAQIMTACREGQAKQIKKLRVFERQFADKHGLKIQFDESALKALGEKAKLAAEDPYDLASALLESYEHGLKLIQQNTGQQGFVISADSIHGPKEALERLVKDSYRKDARGQSSAQGDELS